jgi:MFS family permease
LSWRWVFFVNLPIAALAVLVTLWAIPRDMPETTDRRIDYAGLVTLSLGLVSLLIALDQVTDWGWGDLRIIALIVICVVMLGAFVLIERRLGERALIPPDVMRNRDFSAACLTVLLLSAIFFAVLLFVPQFMEKILGYSPLKSGAGLLPMMGTFAMTSFIAGPLYGRLGPKLIVSLGAGAMGVGIFLLSLIGDAASYGSLVVGLLILGIGAGLFYSSVTTAGVTALDASRAALAGGIVYMFQIAGGSVGLGFNTTLFSTRAEDVLDSHIAALGTKVTDTQSDLMHGILAGTRSGKEVVAQFAPAIAHRLELLVRDAFVSGLHLAFRVDAVLAFCGMLVAIAFVGGTFPHQPRLHELARHHHHLARVRLPSRG